MSGGTWLAVAAGGAIGAVLRYGVSRTAYHVWGGAFPWGTLIANVAGSFLMGVALVWLSRTGAENAVLRGFLMVGVLGAFTTFSTFSLDVITLYKERTLIVVGAYLAGSVLLSIFGLVAGMAFMRGSS